MSTKCIAYRSGYKYQLRLPYRDRIEIRPPAPIRTRFIRLDLDGSLEIEAGYAWDGPSGPSIDTANFMRGSLVHDALYQLMREGYLDAAVHRLQADRTLRRMCIEDGMSRLRAAWVYFFVRRFGDPHADPARRRPVKWAPRKCIEGDEGAA